MSVPATPNNNKQGNCGLKLKIKFSSSKGFVSDFVDSLAPQTALSGPAGSSGLALCADSESIQSHTGVSDSSYHLNRLEHTEPGHSAPVSSPELTGLSHGRKSARRKDVVGSVTVSSPLNSHRQVSEFSELLDRYGKHGQKSTQKSASYRAPESNSCDKMDSRNSSGHDGVICHDFELLGCERDEPDGVTNSAADGHRQQHATRAGLPADGSEDLNALVKDKSSVSEEKERLSCFDSGLCTERDRETMMFTNPHEKNVKRGTASVKYPMENPLFPWSVGDSAVPEPLTDKYPHADIQGEQLHQKLIGHHSLYRVPIFSTSTLEEKNKKQASETNVTGQEDSPPKRVILFPGRDRSEINNNHRQGFAVADSPIAGLPTLHYRGSKGTAQNSTPNVRECSTHVKQQPPRLKCVASLLGVTAEVEHSSCPKWRHSLPPLKRCTSLAGVAPSADSLDDSRPQASPSQAATVTGAARSLQTESRDQGQAGEDWLGKGGAGTDDTPSALHQRGVKLKTVSLLSGNVSASGVHDHSSWQPVSPGQHGSAQGAAVSGSQLHRTIDELRKRVNKDMLPDTSPQDAENFVVSVRNHCVSIHQSPIIVTKCDDAKTLDTVTDTENQGSPVNTAQSLADKPPNRCENHEQWSLKDHSGQSLPTLEAEKSIFLNPVKRLWKKIMQERQSDSAHDSEDREASVAGAETQRQITSTDQVQCDQTQPPRAAPATESGGSAKDRRVSSSELCSCEYPEPYTVGDLWNHTVNKVMKLCACKLCMKKLKPAHKRKGRKGQREGKFCRCLEPDSGVSGSITARPVRGLKHSTEKCRKCLKFPSQLWKKKRKVASRLCQCQTPLCDTTEDGVCRICLSHVGGNRLKEGKEGCVLRESDSSRLACTEPAPQEEQSCWATGDHCYSRSPFTAQVVLKLMWDFSTSSHDSVSPHTSPSPHHHSSASELRDECRQPHPTASDTEGSGATTVFTMPGSPWTLQKDCLAEPPSDLQLRSLSVSPFSPEDHAGLQVTREGSGQKGETSCGAKTSMQTSCRLSDGMQAFNEGIRQTCFVVLKKIAQDAVGKKGWRNCRTPPCKMSCRQQHLSVLCDQGKLPFCEHSLRNRRKWEEQKKARKRDHVRHSAAMQAAEECLQNKMGQEKKLQQVAVDRTVVSDISAAQAFLPLSSLSSDGAVSLRITEEGVSFTGNPSGLGGMEHGNCVFTAASANNVTSRTHHGQPAPEHSGSTPLKVSSDNEACRAGAPLAHLTPVHSSSEPHELSDERELYNKQGALPENSLSQPGREGEGIRVSKFNVKYYVFQSGGRAFVVPLIKTSRGGPAARRLDEEDLGYVKRVISQLLAETDSSARHLTFPDCLTHKVSRKQVAPTGKGEKDCSKKAFVAPTLGEECLDMEGLKSLISDRDFSRLVPHSSRISKSRYLQEVGEKVHMYLTGGQEETPDWIKDVAKGIVARQKSRVQNRKRLKPSKDVSIEIDYAQEQEPVEVGEEAGGGCIDETAGDASSVSVLEDTSVYEGVDQTDMFTPQLSPPEMCAPQQTGSYVCEEAFLQEEKKPLLGELLNITPGAHVPGVEGSLTEPGQQVLVPLPADCGQEPGHVMVALPSQLPSDTSQPADHLHGEGQLAERKPLLGELLLASATGQVSSQESCQQSQPELVPCPLVRVKEEPPDEGYSHAWTDQAQLAASHVNHLQPTELQAIPYISNSTFGTGTVHLEDDADCHSAGLAGQGDGQWDGGQDTVHGEGSVCGAPLIVHTGHVRQGLDSSQECAIHKLLEVELEGSTVPATANSTGHAPPALPHVVSVALGEPTHINIKTERDGSASDSQMFACAHEVIENRSLDDFQLDTCDHSQDLDTMESENKQGGSETVCVSVPQISSIAFGEAAHLWETELASRGQDMAEGLSDTAVDSQCGVPVISSVVCGDAVPQSHLEQSPHGAYCSQQAGGAGLVTGLEDDGDCAEDFGEDDWLEGENNETASHLADHRNGSEKQLLCVSLPAPDQSSLVTSNIGEFSHTLPCLQVGVDLSIVKQEPQEVGDSLQPTWNSTETEPRERVVSPVVDGSLPGHGTVMTALPGSAADIGPGLVSCLGSDTREVDQGFNGNISDSAETLAVPASSLSVPISGHDGDAVYEQSSSPSPAILEVRSLAGLVEQHSSMKPVTAAATSEQAHPLQEAPASVKHNSSLKPVTSASSCGTSQLEHELQKAAASVESNVKHDSNSSKSKLCGSKKRKWKQPVRLQESNALRPPDSGNRSVTVAASCAAPLLDGTPTSVSATSCMNSASRSPGGGVQSSVLSGDGKSCSGDRGSDPESGDKGHGGATSAGDVDRSGRVVVATASQDSAACETVSAAAGVNTASPQLQTDTNALLPGTDVHSSCATEVSCVESAGDGDDQPSENDATSCTGVERVPANTRGQCQSGAAQVMEDFASCDSATAKYRSGEEEASLMDGQALTASSRSVSAKKSLEQNAQLTPRKINCSIAGNTTGVRVPKPLTPNKEPSALPGEPLSSAASHTRATPGPSRSHSESTPKHIEDNQLNQSRTDCLQGAEITACRSPLETISKRSSAEHPASGVKSENVEDITQPAGVSVSQSQNKRKGKRKQKKKGWSKSRKKSKRHPPPDCRDPALEEDSDGEEEDASQLSLSEQSFLNAGNAKTLCCTTEGLSIKIRWASRKTEAVPALGQKPGDCRAASATCSVPAWSRDDQTTPGHDQQHSELPGVDAVAPRPATVDTAVRGRGSTACHPDSDTAVRGRGSTACHPDSDTAMRGRGSTACHPDSDTAMRGRGSTACHPDSDSQTQSQKCQQDSAMESTGPAFLTAKNQRASQQDDDHCDQHVKQLSDQIKPCFVSLLKPWPPALDQSFSHRRPEEDAGSCRDESTGTSRVQPTVESRAHKHSLELDSSNSEEPSSRGSKIRRTDRSIFSELSAAFGEMPAPAAAPLSVADPLKVAPPSRKFPWSPKDTKSGKGNSRSGILPCVAESLKKGLVSHLRDSLASLKDDASAGGSRPSADSPTATAREDDSDTMAPVPENSRDRSFFDCLPQGLKDAWKQ